MGEAKRKQRRHPNEELSEIVITLRGNPAGRAHFAEKIVKLIGPKGGPMVDLDAGDGTSQLRIILRGSEKVRVAAAETIRELVEKEMGNGSIINMADKPPICDDCVATHLRGHHAVGDQHYGVCGICGVRRACYGVDA